MSELGLLPAHILLDFWQCEYAHQILSLPNSILIENIFPITLEKRDGHAQLEDLLKKI